ncbi:MAG: DUF5130 family protein [Actinomycetes bacterium]
MPAGEAFSAGQVQSIERAINQAHTESGLNYSVFVGAPEGELREQGRKLLGALGEGADRAVVVVVDPAQRRLEILTGATAARYLDDRATALGAMSMTSSFTAGDLSGGIVAGLHTLSEHARHPRTLHSGHSGTDA